jgi:hypothetical protein
VALLACAPEPIRVDLDPLRADDLRTLLLAIDVGGTVDVFALDLTADEPSAVLPPWTLDRGESIRLEAHGYRRSVEYLGLTPGRLAAPTGPGRRPPTPTLRRARTVRGDAPGAWEEVTATPHLDALSFAEHPACPKISALSTVLGPRAETPTALARLDDGRWLLALSHGDTPYLLDPAGRLLGPLQSFGVPVTALHVDGRRVFAGTAAGALFEGRARADGVDFDPRPIGPLAESAVVEITAGPGPDLLWTLSDSEQVRRVDLRDGSARVVAEFEGDLLLRRRWLVSDGLRGPAGRAFTGSIRAPTRLLRLGLDGPSTVEVPWGEVGTIAHVPEADFVIAASDQLWRMPPGEDTPRRLTGYPAGARLPRQIVPLERGFALFTFGGSVMIYLRAYNVVCAPVGLTARALAVAGRVDEDTLLVVDSGLPVVDDSVQVWTIRLD